MSGSVISNGGDLKLFSRSRWVRTAASEKVRLHPNPTGFDDPGDIIIFENEFGLLQIDGRPSLLSRSLYEITSCRLYGLKKFSLSFSLPMDNAGDSHAGQPGATNAGQDQGATGGMNLGNSALGYVMVDTGQGAAPTELRQGGVQPAAFLAAGAAAAAGTHTTAPPAPQGPYPQLGLGLSPELLNAVMGVPAGAGAAAQPATLGGGGVPQNGPAIAPAAAGTNTLAYPNFGNDLPQTTFNQDAQTNQAMDATEVIPKQEKCSRPPGRPAAASQRRMATKHVLKSPDAGLSGSPSGRDAERPASFSVGCGISGSSCNTQTHHRRRRDDGDPRFENRLARDRASRPARASCGRRAWRGCGARRGSRRARVVCHAERRRGKLKRKRRSRVMVCVSVFVTHQEARGRF